MVKHFATLRFGFGAPIPVELKNTRIDINAKNERKDFN
jgi:hypothetical protein